MLQDSQNHTDLPLGSSVWILIFAQIIGPLGASIARFGFYVWIYQHTQSINAFAYLAIASSLPGIIASPIAGSIVDRSSRKKVLLFSSIVQVVGTIIIFLCLSFQSLSLPIIILASCFASIGEAFQWPALSSIITTLVPKSRLGRVNGLITTAETSSKIFAPVLGGVAYSAVGVKGLALVEIVTFFISFTSILSIKIPQKSFGSAKSKSLFAALRTIYSDSKLGFAWIKSNPMMGHLLLLFIYVNLWVAIINISFVPYYLSFLDEVHMGVIRGLFAGGMVIGGGVMSVWRGNNKIISRMFGGMLVFGICEIVLGSLKNFYLLFFPVLLAGISLPIVNVSSQIIWQMSVPNDLQGRVFALRRMASWGAIPVSVIFTIPLAEYMIKPLVSTNLYAQSFFSSVWGTGKAGYLGLMTSVVGSILVLGVVWISKIIKAKSIGFSIDEIA